MKKQATKRSTKKIDEKAIILPGKDTVKKSEYSIYDSFAVTDKIVGIFESIRLNKYVFSEITNGRGNMFLNRKFRIEAKHINQTLILGHLYELRFKNIVDIDDEPRQAPIKITDWTKNGHKLEPIDPKFRKQKGKLPTMTKK